MAFTIDTSTEHGAKVARQVVERSLGWLTTVSSDGTPQPNPVWFIWDDGSFVIFSRPNQAKLTNIARHPRVSFNFEATEDEEQVTIFTGSAQIIDRATLPQSLLDAYAAKYAEGMIRIELPRERYEQEYTAVIRVTPEK
ncbi:MAG: TIGR03667 family PPOX class F420-dependent oxidoreductase, partial [Chloroflexota bacterium]|nr:TIGR03667 family PPOX class F420-dependent oxidoreductase [Chloroflexota bacterium]